MAFALLRPSRHDIYPFIDPRGALKGAAAGKTVLVTGAGSGIGRGIAQSFALAGASEVVLAARRTDKLEETKATIYDLAPDCKVTVHGGIDISDNASVGRLFGALRLPPDVVVSNAAVTLARADIEKSDPELVAKEIDINVKGPYLVARAYVEAVNAAGREGCLINVSSESSWRFIPRCSTYAPTKVALNIFTEHLQREQEIAKGGVRCVAMHPGGVFTDLGGEMMESVKHLLIDTPALPGGTAVYLSTDRARFLMGRYVPAVADMEEIESLKDRIVREDIFKTRVVGWLGSQG